MAKRAEEELAVAKERLLLQEDELQSRAGWCSVLLAVCVHVNFRDRDRFQTVRSIGIQCLRAYQFLISGQVCEAVLYSSSTKLEKLATTNSHGRALEMSTVKKTDDISVGCKVWKMIISSSTGNSSTELKHLSASV